MAVSTGPFVHDIRLDFADLWLRQQRGDGVAVAGTLEIVGASFIADEEAIFGTVNQDYVDRELAWYRSQSLYVDDIPGQTPKIWEQVSSSQGKINSNYGYLLYSDENGAQYEHVLKALKTKPDGRQAVAVYTRPSIQWEWNEDGMHDFICTNAVHYELRDGQLHVVVQMRSNDAVFGYKNDLAWQRRVQTNLCDELGVEPGGIVWQAASLHVYDRHWPLIEEFVNGI